MESVPRDKTSYINMKVEYTIYANVRPIIQVMFPKKLNIAVDTKENLTT
jgi:hypothetical protein